jgi:two-component system chemotaxis response regulator CheB
MEELTPGVPPLAAPDQPIVTLVCSAGGLNALLAILDRLPGNFPGTVIVLQHQSPERPSPLAKILALHCALPVSEASDQHPLLPGTVVVVPPGCHALVAHDRVALIPSDGPPPYRPSADLLLTSLALTAPQRTIAVILSGSGNDGATGATALHDFGGTVIAADRGSSANFGMPGAAISRDDVVDHVRPVQEIADLVLSLVRDRRSTPSAGAMVGAKASPD